MAWVVLTVLGILIETIIEKYSKGNKSIKLWLVTFAFICVAIIYDTWGRLEAPGMLYEAVDTVIKMFLSNYVLQACILLVVVILITYLKNTDGDVCSFSEYSKQIQEFTARAGEGSKIELIAGDMDFFGEIGNDDIKVDEVSSMENSEEYKQLRSLKDKIRLQILCNDKLEVSLKQAILNNTIDVQGLYRKNRLSETLQSSAFQQLLRIGKIKYEFGNRVDFRFYNNAEDDKQLRARFIESANGYEIRGIVYHKENYIRQNWFDKFVKKLWGKSQTEEARYSVHHLDRDEIGYYKDMCDMKWRESNSRDSQKIAKFCEELYRFAKKCEQVNKMALIYVNSYEVARKKERKEFPPFGVLYLAAVVEEEGWEVEIFSVDENNYDLPLEKFDVVGFSIVSSYSYKFLKLCCDLNSKKMKNDVVKIAGGYQAEKISDRVFRDFDVDIIFCGEGEDSIREFVNNFKNSNYGDIEGIIYKGKNHKIFKNPERKNCVDINRLPFPARHLLDRQDVVMTDRLAGKDIPMVHMLFSRGCSYGCLYCAANKDGKQKTIRYRAKENIVEELREMKEKFEIQGFSIIDDCFLTNAEAAMEICAYIEKSKLNLQWSLAARVDQINKNILGVLKQAGCIEIKFGIETGSNKLLQDMKKGITAEQARNVIKMTHDEGISVKVFIITGLPGETDDTHNETITFLTDMKPYINRISLLRFTPLDGSYIYSHPTEFDINPHMLKIENFDKMRLYRRSTNWWSEKNRFHDCERWYNEMQHFIDENWDEN